MNRSRKNVPKCTMIQDGTLKIPAYGGQLLLDVRIQSQMKLEAGKLGLVGAGVSTPVAAMRSLTM